MDPKEYAFDETLSIIKFQPKFTQMSTTYSYTITYRSPCISHGKPISSLYIAKSENFTSKRAATKERDRIVQKSDYEVVSSRIITKSSNNS